MKDEPLGKSAEYVIGYGTLRDSRGKSSDYNCDIFDETWLTSQDAEYQRSVWTGRAKARLELSLQSVTPREKLAHLNAAGNYERTAFACMDYEGKEI